jgi:putative transposon-encoded protein
MNKKTITLEGYEVKDNVVKSFTNSGYIPAPKKWVGKRVSVVLLEPVDDIQ